MNKIICGECANVLAGFSDDIIDLTVTSPPYDNLRDYNGYTFEFEKIAQQLWRVTKPGGVVVWVVADATIDGSETGTSFRQALYFMGLGFNLHDTMIYDRKKSATYDPRNKRYKHQFEYMFIFSKGTPSTYNEIKDTLVKYKKTTAATGRKPNGTMRVYGNVEFDEYQARSNIWGYSNGFMKTTTDKIAYTHPAIFPEALARDHIISWSNPGDIVLDPMCGSGTTLKMAVEQGRQYIGIDISEKYCLLSQKRVAGARVPLTGLLEPEPKKPEAKQMGIFEND